MTRYGQGFMNKCAEMGLSPLQSVKLYAMKKEAGLTGDQIRTIIGAGGGAVIGAGAGALASGDKKRKRGALLGGVLGAAAGGVGANQLGKYNDRRLSGNNYNSADLTMARILGTRNSQQISDLRGALDVGNAAVATKNGRGWLARQFHANRTDDQERAHAIRKYRERQARQNVQPVSQTPRTPPGWDPRIGR